MREMKDSGVEWIGEIPKDWEVTRIGSYFSERKEPNTDDLSLQPLQFRYGNIVPKTSVWEGEEASQTYMAYNIVDPNIIMINGLNLEFDFITQRVGLVEERGIITSVYLALDPSCEIFPRFGLYLFKSYDFCKVFHSLGSGMRKTLTYRELKKQPIVLPSLQNQHRIADYLDTKCTQIDRAIARQQEVIEKLKEYKLSVITEAVTKGLNPDVPMKDSGIEWIGEIPEEWVLMKLRFAVENIGDIDHYMPASVDIGIPYVMTRDLHDLASAINFQECKMVSTEDYVELSSKIAIQKGDLLFARYATIGTICYVDLDREFLVSYSCVIIKPNEDLMLGKFLYYVMKSNTFAEEVKQYTNSNTQGNVGIEALYRSKVVVPSVLQQKEIIGFLEDKCTLVDKSIVSKMGLVNKLEEYKKSLIYEVVTGKREV